MADYQISAADIRKSLAQEGINIPSSKQQSFLDKAGNIAGKFNEFIENTGLPNLGAHVLSAPMHLAANIANAPGALSNYAFGTNVPQIAVPENFDPAKLVRKNDTPLTNAMGVVGDIIGGGIGGGAAYKGAEQALNIGAKTPLYLRSLFGAGAGAAMSDSEQPGGRALGAILGGALPAAYGLTSRAIGKRASQIAAENKENSKQIYNQIFDEAEQYGLKDIRLPQALNRASEKRNMLLKNTNNTDNARIRTFMQNPTLQNAHNAQSDLGKIIRKIEGKLKKGQNLSSSEQEVLPIAKDLQKRIRGSMQNAFGTINRPDLAEQYGQATRLHAQNVAPFSNEPSIAQYQSNQISPAKTGKELIRSGQFSKSSASKQVPGYGVRRSFEELPSWQKAIIGAGGLGALGAIGVPIPNYIRELLSKGYG